MNNSRERIYNNEYNNTHTGISDRNRSIEKPPSHIMSDMRNRYAVQNPSPTAARREGQGYRKSGEGPMMVAGNSRDKFGRVSQGQLETGGERTRNGEGLAARVMSLETKNKELYEIYTRNEKKGADILKTAKEDNQVLLRNLKKLLTIQVINSEALQNNPASEKFIIKLKEFMASGNQTPVRVIGRERDSGRNHNGSQVNDPMLSENINKLMENENNYIVHELPKTNDARGWITALSYSKYGHMNG